MNPLRRACPGLVLAAAAAAAAAASALQAPLLPPGLATPPSPNVSLPLFAELEELSRLVDISYCIGFTSPGISAPFTCPSRCADFPSLELVTTWNTGALLSDSCGYIALDHTPSAGRILVAFRGTYSIANAVVDLSSLPQPYVPYNSDDGDHDDGDDVGGDENKTETETHGNQPPACTNCTVHAGFHRAWLNTRPAILPVLRNLTTAHPSYSLHLVGHSLGGAVAALAGLDLQARGLRPTVTTFGEPRVGNAALARHLDRRFSGPDDKPQHNTRFRRVTHVDDPIPLLPPRQWGWAMHAGEIFISKRSLSPDVGDVKLCHGAEDRRCIAGQDGGNEEDSSANHGPNPRGLLQSVEHEIADVRSEPWGLPARYRLWQLFFAHRDYFFRLGLCLPAGDHLIGSPAPAGGRQYDSAEQDGDGDGDGEQEKMDL